MTKCSRISLLSRLLSNNLSSQVAYKTRNYVKYLDTVVTQASSCQRAVYPHHHQVLYRSFRQPITVSRSPLSSLHVRFLSRSIYENCRVDLLPCLHSSIRAIEDKEKKGERIFFQLDVEKKKKRIGKLQFFQENGRRYKMPGERTILEQNTRL